MVFILFSDFWFGDSVTSIAETIIIGFGDWKTGDGEGEDRTNILTPTVGDDFYCKGESYTCFGPDLCNGCLSVNDFGNLEAILKCCETRKVGGNADILLDWLLTEILEYVSEIVLPGQVLTDREHLAVIGYRYSN